MEEETCEGCGKVLTPRMKKVWFEMNALTHEVWEEGTPNPPKWSGTEDSQGCFVYGSECAKRVRKTGKAFFE